MAAQRDARQRKSGEAPSSTISHHEPLSVRAANSPHQRPQWFRVYHGHRVSTITLARREYRFGKHSGAATRGIRLWKKNRGARRDLNKPCNLMSQNSYLAPRFVSRIPHSHTNFSFPFILPLFFPEFSMIQIAFRINVFTRNVGS